MLHRKPPELRPALPDCRALDRRSETSTIALHSGLRFPARGRGPAPSTPKNRWRQGYSETTREDQAQTPVAQKSIGRHFLRLLFKLPAQLILVIRKLRRDLLLRLSLL